MQKHAGLLVATAILILYSSPILATPPGPGISNRMIKISFGYKSKNQQKTSVVLKTSVPGMLIKNVTGKGTEANDSVGDVSHLNYGSGDIDELIADMTWNKPSADERKVFDKAKMWKHLLEHGDRGQVQRLLQDPWK